MTTYNDLKAGAHVHMREPHAMVHRGNKFLAWFYEPTLSDGETMNISFKTPTDREIHFRYGVGSPYDGHIELLEGTTFSGWEGFSVINRNRQRSAPIYNFGHVLAEFPNGLVGTGQVLLNPAITDSGEVIDRLDWYGHSFNEGHEENPEQEFVLKEDTNYTIMLTNDSNQYTGGRISIDFYEVPERNYDSN